MRSTAEGVRKFVRQLRWRMSQCRRRSFMILTQFSHHEALDVLRDHPGYVLWERLSSYRTSLQVLETSVEDLLGTIQKLRSAPVTGTFSIWHATRS